MSTIAYLTIKAQRQGVIKGGVTIKGREGTIAVDAVRSQIETPIDPRSGALTGKRQHHPIAITMSIDQSSPKLYQALITNETLTDVTIAFWRPSLDRSGNPSGPETQYFTITLTNAYVVGVTLDSQDPTKTAAAPYEEVQLTYQKIAWTWNDGGISAMDDWTTPA